ncbi:MAG: choice-of-anchor L domain-containing protein, partial [Candidatus Bipolaricaulia bacterium]
MRSKKVVLVALVAVTGMLLGSAFEACGVDAIDLANAILSQQAQCMLESAVLTGLSNQGAVLFAPIGDFPLDGDSYGVLSSGVATDVVGAPTDSASSNLGGVAVPSGSPDGYDAFDVVTLSMVLDLPVSADSLELSFAFGTEENPDYLGTSLQDYFQAFVIGGLGGVPVQVALLPDGSPVTLDNADPYSAPVAGTSMNVLTSTMVISVDLSGYAGGLLTLLLELADASDSVVDSAVLLDGLLIRLLPVRGIQVVPMGYEGAFLDRDLPIGGGGATGGQLTVVGYRSLQAVYEIGETIIGDWL